MSQKNNFWTRANYRKLPGCSSGPFCRLCLGKRGLLANLWLLWLKKTVYPRMHEEKCKAILAQTLRSRLTCWIVLRMDPLGACYKQLSARKNRRYAINGNLYTWQQYQEYYWKRGYQSVLSAWESSAHFKDLSEFREYFHVQVVR